MRNFKRITALLLVLVMCLAYIPAPAHAASLSELQAVNGTVVLDGTNSGTVRVAITTPSTISITALQGNWSIQEEGGTAYLTLIELGSDNMEFTGDNDVQESEGYVVWADDSYLNPAVFEKNEKILYATYSVAANTPAGEYTVIFDPWGGIYDEEWNEYSEVFTCKIIVTVDAPACDHADKTYTYETNNNGTHKVICACGETVKADAACDGTATCTVKAKCSLCKAEHGDFAGHEYGQLIPAQDPVHNEDELTAGVAAHYQCSVCNAYFTEEKVETTLEELKGEPPVHTETTRIETTPAACTEEGKRETVSFCSECGLEISRELIETIPAGHTWGAVSYNWSADNFDCTASRTCQVEGCGEEETEKVTISSEITTPGSCTVKEVVTYTADFAASWAVDQEKAVTDDYRHDGSCEACAPAELVAVDGTVTLNGTDSGTVRVAISTTNTFYVTALQGNWSIQEEGAAAYLTLIELGSDNMEFTGDNDVQESEGYVVWVDDSYLNPAVFEKNEKILYATYSVTANTPAGEYTVIFDPWGGIYDEEWNEYSEVFTCKITVIVDAPACDHDGKEYSYDDNGDGTHTVTCECGGIVDANADHESDAEFPCQAGKCQCGADVPATAEHEYTYDCDKNCAVCGEETRPEAEHSFTVKQSETAATCVAEGSIVWKCASCEATKTEVLPTDASNHTGNKTTGVNAKEATCTAEGYTGDTVCECGETVAYGQTIEMAEHSFTVKQSETAATCVAEGSIVWKCANCDATKTEVLLIDATNHTGNNTTGVNAKEATCTAEGHTGDTVCECGETVAYGQTIEMAEHSFTVKKNETLATCKAEGSIVWKCANCEATKTETLTIDASNHTGNNTTGVNAKEATCTAEGYTGDTVCECGETVAYGQTIEMAEHSFTVKQSETAATCVAEGSIVWKCANCEATKTEVLLINASNHTGNNTTGVNAKEATCTEEGYTGDTVCECGETVAYGQTIEIDLSNHTSEEFEYTDNEDGATHTKAHKCCGTAIDDQEAHDYVDGQCVCGAEKAADAITVIAKGEVEYEVAGNVVTVSHTAACKVGYWDAENSKYVAIEAQPNEDGTYSFTAPEGVTTVLVVVKGDTTLNGELASGDVSRLKAYVLGKVTLSPEEIFAAEVTGDGQILSGDASKITATILGKTELKWDE